MRTSAAAGRRLFAATPFSGFLPAFAGAHMPGEFENVLGGFDVLDIVVEIFLRGPTSRRYSDRLPRDEDKEFPDHIVSTVVPQGREQKASC
jgi:hypothetical protein